MTRVTASDEKPAATTLYYVAIGQMVPGGRPESLNTFEDVNDAAACAGEFAACHPYGCAAWVETIEVKPVTKESQP
ncbi:hypothetical protein [Accumulibacter sp.]|uniref:hypothetical protein n=1 Tax=Accumulibacter sp. TaxID=2053492 RepID=UPI0025EA4C05|nr:hypothetical protein [Accumulibacter sp.]MCM8595150.1 hypothetical protein [Accumulibacter sp.]MCM8626187.1 hypothetical protein [Accumulibacter sp.]MDS4049296.1 hypothetical protein [Accumulibacter sp.]